MILVTGGTYQDQIINSKPTAGSPGVVIQAAPDAAVTIKELKISASWLTLRNMTVMPVAGRTPSDKLIDIKPGPRYLTLDNVDLDGRINGVRQVRDGLGISGDTDYVTVRNSDICCVQDSKLIQIQTYGTSIQNRHLTLSRNTIHDDWQTDSSKHLECLWLEGISDFLFEGNHLWDCALNAIIANADEGGTYANWTIINNVFESADAGAGGVPPDFDACASTHPKTNWLFAYNYFSRGLALTSCGGTMGWLTLRGNIGAAGDFNAAAAPSGNTTPGPSANAPPPTPRTATSPAPATTSQPRPSKQPAPATTAPPPQPHPKSTPATPPSGPQQTPTATRAPSPAAPTAAPSKTTREPTIRLAPTHRGRADPLPRGPAPLTRAQRTRWAAVRATHRRLGGPTRFGDEGTPLGIADRGRCLPCATPPLPVEGGLAACRITETVPSSPSISPPWR